MRELVVDRGGGRIRSFWRLGDVRGRGGGGRGRVGACEAEGTGETGAEGCHGEVSFWVGRGRVKGGELRNPKLIFDRLPYTRFWLFQRDRTLLDTVQSYTVNLWDFITLPLV